MGNIYVLPQCEYLIVGLPRDDVPIFKTRHCLGDTIGFFSQRFEITGTITNSPTFVRFPLILLNVPIGSGIWTQFIWKFWCVLRSKMNQNERRLPQIKFLSIDFKCSSLNTPNEFKILYYFYVRLIRCCCCTCLEDECKRQNEVKISIFFFDFFFRTFSTPEEVQVWRCDSVIKRDGVGAAVERGSILS